MNYQTIFDEIKKEIVFFRLKPGDLISETDLVQRFKISRTPIRDIIKKLEYEGFVEVRPQKGTFVTSIDVSKLYEIMYLREILEINVAKSLIDKVKVEELSTILLIVEKQIKVVNSSLSEYEKAEKFLNLDDEFHETLFSMANKSYLWDVVAKLKTHYYRVRYLLNLRNQDDMFKVCEQHKKIIEAIYNKDEKALIEDYHSHIYEGLKDLPSILEKYHYYFKI